MVGQLLNATLWLVIAILNFFGRSFLDSRAEALPEDVRPKYLRQKGLCLLAFALIIVAMAFVERYQLLSDSLFVSIYCAAGAIILIALLLIQRKYGFLRRK